MPQGDCARQDQSGAFVSVHVYTNKCTARALLLGIPMAGKMPDDPQIPSVAEGRAIPEVAPSWPHNMVTIIDAGTLYVVGPL